MISQNHIIYLVHLRASAYFIDNSKHCLNSSSLPGTAASPLELPLGRKRHFHEAESLYYRTKEGGECKNCAMKNEMRNS